MSRIHSIVYQTERSEKESKRYNRTSADTVELIAGHGIQGDRKAGKNRKRQLNVMMRETLDELANIGYRTAPGEMGEQIVLQGLAFDSLKAGTQIRLGNDAVIELTTLRTPCDWLEMVQDRPAKRETKGRLGFMAKVVVSGTIQVDDSVTILQPSHEQAN